MSTVFITGITGFLGNTLAIRLKNEGNTIIGLARNPSKFRGDNNGIEFITGDLQQFELIEEKIKKTIPIGTAFYHCAAILGAAQASKKTYWKINVEGTHKLFILAKELQASKFVFISSMGAAGPVGSKENPIDEKSKERPRAYYSRSKLEAERKLMMANLENEMPTVIIRPPVIFGPYMNPNSGAAIVFSGCNKRLFAIIGNGKNLVNFAYIDNVVEGVIHCANQVNQGSEIFFISDNTPYILKEMIDEIKHQLNSNTKIIKFPYFLAFPLAWIVEKFGKLIRRDIGFNTELVKGLATNAFVFSIQKAKNIGFQPKIDLEQGISNTIEYLENK